MKLGHLLVDAGVITQARFEGKPEPTQAPKKTKPKKPTPEPKAVRPIPLPPEPPVPDREIGAFLRLVAAGFLLP